METIMSSRLPPLPIVIEYFLSSLSTPSRLLSALKYRDRVRGITLVGDKPEFADFSKRPHAPLRYLGIDTAFGPSQQESLPVYLRGLPRLRRLELKISCPPTNDPAHIASPEHVVPLSELTCFRYHGPSISLDALVAEFAATSLKDFQAWISIEITPPNSHLRRFIGDVEGSVDVCNSGC
jgi:hypothetical protein